MRRALVTFAVGRYTELLDISRPTFEGYANRHGYEYIERILPVNAYPRPPAWFRIPVLQETLPAYDEVLCLGADMIVVDGSQDIATVMEDDKLLGIVGHDTKWGFVPSTEMLYMRQAFLPWLDKAWDLTQYRNHPWWDQAAINNLLGFDPGRYPLEHVRETELYRQTQFLPLEWHSHESYCRHPNPRFVEATHGTLEWRKEVLTRYRGLLAA